MKNENKKFKEFEEKMVISAKAYAEKEFKDQGFEKKYSAMIKPIMINAFMSGIMTMYSISIQYLDQEAQKSEL